MRYTCGNNWKTWWCRGCTSRCSTARCILICCGTAVSRGGSSFAFPFCGSLAAHAFPAGPHAKRCGAWLPKVRLAEEIRSVGAGKIAACAAVRMVSVGHLEKVDFLESRALREAIHAREGGFCFYCLGRLRPRVRCLDHVVARVRGGNNGYRNLVSACSECNSQKGERRAEDFLRWLCREGRLSAGELSGRFRALAKLAAGKLRPRLTGQRDRGKGR